MPDNKRPITDLLSGLADMVNDLYSENAAALERLNHEVKSSPLVLPELMQTPGARPAAPKPSSSPLSPLSLAPAAPSAAAKPAAPASPAKPVLPPFADLWKTADDVIDWTEALASPTPTDGLTDPEKWALYHEQAARVLHGDVGAYLTVLQAANPMADLVPFAGDVDVTTTDSETLTTVFTPRPDLLAGDQDACRRYLAGMAVRIARDLFAVLPVTVVKVEALHEGAALLTASFERQEMNKVRFAYIDPVSFTLDCGGVFADDAPDA